MYTYIKAFGVSSRNAMGLTPVDIMDIPVNEFTQEFSKLLIVIEDNYTNTTGTLDIINYLEDMTTFIGNIQEWLDAQINVNLILDPKIPKDEYSFVTTGDLQYKWFSLYPGDVALSDDRQELLTTSSAPDIRFSRTDKLRIDYQRLIDYCLFTVNGHLTRAVKGNNEIYLINAGKHFKANDDFHITYLNFNKVSKLATYATEEENIITSSSQEGYVHLHYKSPVDLTNKKVYMSIMGRLFLNDVVTHIGNNILNIKLNRADWFSMVFDSKMLIDLSHVINKRTEVISRDFFNEEFFRKIMIDPSSFLIVLDNPDIHVYTKPITMYQYPFTYHTTETRDIPLLTAGGLLPKYFVRKIGHRRLLDIDIGVQRIYLDKTAGKNNQGDVAHGYSNMFKSSDLSRGYQLYIRGLTQDGGF